MIYYKKHTNRKCIKYDEALDEALCFGWIDSIIKRIDDDIYVRKFTPRRLYSNWSEVNINKVESLKEEGKMTEIGLNKYNARFLKKNKRLKKVIELLIKDEESGVI